MDRKELYNAAVAVYNETGQGLPGRLMRMNGMGPVIDGLIEEGLFRSIEQTYGFLPDDEWICLTKGYCVEDTYTEEVDALTNVRIYKGIWDSEDEFEFGGLTIETIMQDEDFKKQYDKWLAENKEKLEEKIDLI